MKSLSFPFRGKERKVVLHESVLFVPDRLEAYEFPEFSNQALFGNNHPIHIEYCSGNGAWIIAKAMENPHINWIAIEKKFDRVSKIHAKQQKRGLKNLLIIYGEGLNITSQFIPNRSAAQVFVNFPDPWPKKRHWKHRIISQKFLAEMHRILKDRGQVTLVTDDAQYSEVMTEELKLSKKFTPRHPEPFFITDLPGYGNSFFEELWRSHGKQIHYHQWEAFSAKEALLRCEADSSSSLDWSAVRSLALREIASGKKILWFLDFGLFDRLLKPHQDPGQFNSFALAIEHFHTKMWAEFHKFSIGVCLYQGNADFTSQLKWDEGLLKTFSEWLMSRFATEDELQKESCLDFTFFNESYPCPKTKEGQWILSLFARDLCSEYLKLLASKMPDGMTPYIVFNKAPQEPLLKALLTSPESYGKITVLSDGGFSWRTKEELSFGVYMPLSQMVKPSKLMPYSAVFEDLKHQEYKLIPENELTVSWTNLHRLTVHLPAISAAGHRKIQGFEAAGGEIAVV